MRGTLNNLVRLVALGAAVGAVSACDVVVTSLESKGKAQEQWSRTYQLGSGELEIVNTNGSIEVVGAEGTEVQIVAELTAKGATDEDAKKVLADVRIAENVSASRIRLETKPPTGEGRRVDAKYRVKVPASLNLRITTQNGSLDASAIKGTLKAETGNGSVKGRDLTGSVEATTTNGSVRLDVVAVAAGGIRAETVNGSVDVSMPAAAKADVQANCVNGRISVEGMKLDGPETTRRRVEGRLNGGGPKIVLETTNGRIQLTGK
jgi:DUF4097 and DUF4098 domain-containing protein YvlB